MSRRVAGCLLHPTCLPGGFGIGDLGPEVPRFLDWARAAGFEIWQVLPLGPTGDDGSPYAGVSAFAGNPLLVSPERLVETGVLGAGALEGAPRFASDRVDFHAVRVWKERIFVEAWERFRADADATSRERLEAFRADPANALWLEDWALYRALKARFEGAAWTAWDRDLARRRPAALEAARRELRPSIDRHAFVQFLFFEQWEALRREARSRGIRILGDLPIYPAHDSADVWARQDLFDLDADGRPLGVAGVPPDYFSETGQLWGNPLYRWDRIEQQGYAWWIERIRANLRCVDLLRIDHFRGYESYWAVPASEPTAANGRWIVGPGARLFDALRGALGFLPFVAEDLGLITPEVRALRKTLGLPGMKVLQFGFDELDSDHLPHRHAPEEVVYTGTHDNDTVAAWFGKLSEEARARVRDYLGADSRDVAWAMIRAAYASVGETVIVPLQDALGLGGEARMNVPGRAEGNWSWRVEGGALGSDLAKRLRRIAELTGRAPAAGGSGS